MSPVLSEGDINIKLNLVSYSAYIASSMEGQIANDTYSEVRWSDPRFGTNKACLMRYIA